MLELIFSEIILPEEVNKEILQLKKLGQDISEYENANWIKIQNPVNFQKTNELKDHLDEGEA